MDRLPKIESRVDALGEEPCTSHPTRVTAALWAQSSLQHDMEGGISEMKGL